MREGEWEIESTCARARACEDEVDDQDAEKGQGEDEGDEGDEDDEEDEDEEEEDEGEEEEKKKTKKEIKAKKENKAKKKKKTKEKKEKEKKGKRIRPKIEAKAEAWGSSPSPSSSPQQQVVRSWQEEVSSCGGETEWEPGDWEVPVQLREGSLGVTMRERSGALFVWEFKPGSPAVDVLQCGDQLLSLGLGTTRIPVSTISQMKTAMAHLKDARGLRANDIVLLGMRRNS